MTVLVPYKRMPIWNQDTVPQHFDQAQYQGGYLGQNQGLEGATQI